MKPTRTLILHNSYLLEVVTPILNSEKIKFFESKNDNANRIDEILGNYYPSLIIIESNKNNHKNLELLKKCIRFCENSNIVFVTDSNDLNSCVKLVKAGADEILNSSDLSSNVALLNELASSLNYRKRMVRKSDNENVSQTVAKIGSWEYNLVQDVLFWSAITKQLHEVPEDYQPTVEEAISFYDEGWSRQMITQAFSELIETGKQLNVELPITTANKKAVWVNARGFAQFIGDKCVRVYGTFQDITHYKILENQLRNSEIKYQKVVEASNDIIWEIEVGVDIINYFRISKLQTHALKKISFRGILRKIHADDRQRFNSSIKAAISSTDMDTWNCQYRIKNETGEYVWIEDNASIIRDDSGIALKIIGAAKNITEKIDYLKKIETQNAIFKKITWTQSHVLRSPVVNILGLLGLVKTELNSTDQPSSPDLSELVLLLEKATLDLDETVKETVKHSTDALKSVKKNASTTKKTNVDVIRHWY